jgi:hypothetical protein
VQCPQELDDSHTLLMAREAEPSDDHGKHRQDNDGKGHKPE